MANPFTSGANACTATVEQFLQLGPNYGLPAANYVPASLRSQAAIVAARNPPANPNSVHYQGKVCPTINASTANLIMRGLLYWRTDYVPCSKSVPLDLSGAQITGEVGSIAIGIASMAGTSIPGIGPAIAAIKSIFQHHALAVAKEQDTICSVAGVINQVLAHLDAQVLNGTISPSTASAGLQTYIAQVSEQLATITTANPCNAGCVMQSYLAAHADFAQSYYPAIAPLSFFSSAPGGFPSSLSGIPGGIIQVGEKIVNLPLAALGINATANQLFAVLVVVILLIVVGLARVKT
jgi:hypothetical protein